MPSADPALRRMSWLLGGLALLFVVVWQAPVFYTVHGMASYLPVHMFAETFSIIISMMVFGVAWNAYSMERSGNMTILACASLAVGAIDFAHMLSFKGMPEFITPSGPEKAINLWLSARAIAALALLAVALRPWQPFHSLRVRYELLAGSLIITALIVWAGIVYPEAWPRTFIPGQGLTPFKIGAEYAIIAVLLVPAVLFYRQARQPQPYDALGLFAATVVTILSELCFTLYSDVADVFNLLGHLYKIVAYGFVYRAVFVAGVRDPFKRLDVGLAENQRMSKELRTASLYTRSLIEASLDPLVTINAEGKITDVNQATEEVTGRNRTELIGTDFSDYFTEPDKARAGYRQVFERGFVTDYPLALRHRDGHVTDVLYNASVYRDEAGEVLGVFAAARDITERKRAEATRTQLAAIVESSSDAIIGKTTDGIITTWNKGAENIYGYSADEIVGKHVTVLASPAGHAEIYEIMETVRKGGTVANHESERLRKDGTPIHVALTLSPIRDAAGAITGISTIARDITEKKRMEERLRQANVYNRSLIEASLDPLVTISAEGKITDVNVATENVTGRSRAELIGTDFSDYFTEPDKAREGYQQVFAQGSVTDYPLALRHRDGHVTDVLYNASVYRDEAGEVLGVFAAARDITERKKAEREVAQLSLQNKLILDSAGEGIYGLGLDGHCTFVNPSAVQLLGFGAEELIGEHAHYLFHHTRPDGRPYPEEECPVQMAYRQGEVHRGDDLYWRKDGSSFPVEFISTPILDAGKIRGAVVTFRDITERKLAEEKLRRSEHSLAEAQRIAHLGNWELDLVHNVLSWSAEIYRIFEIDPEKFGASYEAFLNAIHPDDRDMVNKAYTDSVANKVPYDIVHRLRMQDGRIKYVNEMCETYYGEDGKPLRSVGTVHDITERKLAELELLERERHSQSLLNLSRKLERSQSYAEVLAAARDEVRNIIGYQNLWAYLLSEDKKYARALVAGGPASDTVMSEEGTATLAIEGDRMLEEIAQAKGIVVVEDAQTDERVNREIVARMGNRTIVNVPIMLFERHLGSVGMGTFGEEGVRIPSASEQKYLMALASHMAAALDRIHLLAERRKAEDQVTELNRDLEQRVVERTAQLEAANKELEAFAYSVSHDLRTPLRAIDGFSRIVLDDYRDKLDDEGRRLLNVVRDNTVRMGQLIDDILKFSRAGRTEIAFSEIDMERMAQTVAEELRPPGSGDRLQIEIEHLPPARGDSAMMRQVFVNLLSNAIKFSRTREPARIRVGGSIEGDEAVYFVRDNGAGFDMQYAGRLFGVFQRLHDVNEFEGTGIGLAIVKRIVTRHGGRVWAEGKVNEGATIYFALPGKGEEHA